jgi:hypothetical protein
MKWRWRVVLPAIGILVFGAVSYHSLHVDRDKRRASKKYFWWSAIRLDSDSANKHLPAITPCNDGTKDCANWALLPDRWVDPGSLEIAFVMSALPVFLSGVIAVVALEKLGISQVLSFMLVMPMPLSSGITSWAGYWIGV